MQRQVEQVRAFLYGWLVEGGHTPRRVTDLYDLTFSYAGGNWERLNAIENAVEDWAIELRVNTTPVDEAHPDSPMADNIVRKLMVIRGSAWTV